MHARGHLFRRDASGPGTLPDSGREAAITNDDVPVPDAADPASHLRGDWHALTGAEVAHRLEADADRGLSEAEADRRRRESGPNRLPEAQPAPWHAVLLRQYADVLIGVLLLAAVVAALIGQLGDALTILFILLANGLVGFAQEWRAERALVALKAMAAPRCRVVRSGRTLDLAASDLVAGDVVRLAAGDRVPADLRLLEAVNLRLDEAMLTGRVVQVDKDAVPVPVTVPASEPRDMAWMGTAVVNGRGRGFVVATGPGTRLGRIAGLGNGVANGATPLQRRLAALGQRLGLACIAVCALVAGAGWLLGKPLSEMFLTGVSLAVAVVPEGLPVVVTVAMALGVRAMARRRVLVRRLQAVEAIGRASVICTGLTGTLTRHALTATRLWLPAGALAVTGEGYRPDGRFEVDGKPVAPARRPDLLALLEAGRTCGHARVEPDGTGWRAVGDPTDAALEVAARKAGLGDAPPPAPVGEFSFTKFRKRMTVVVRGPSGLTAYVKGAPELVLARCTRVLEGGTERSLDDAGRRAAAGAHLAMARAGLRTLAVGRRDLPDGAVPPEGEVEHSLTLLGIVGLADPLRPEAAAAVGGAAAAGARVVLVTGDAPEAALAVAARVGLPAARAVTAEGIDALDDRALGEALEAQAVFARATPEQKLRVVHVLKARGHVVAMTGAGVNDAPALQAADIGVAMGEHGTDVSVAASALVLADDNLASLVAGIGEGRRQFDNIRKFVHYMLASNLGEVVAICLNILIGGPLILLPVQILWMNLVTDGVIAIALGFEPSERGLMRRTPEEADAPVIDRGDLGLILALGAYIGLATLWLFHRALASDGPEAVATAQTAAFTGIILIEMVNVFNFRSRRAPLWVAGLLTNPWLLVAWGGTLAVQLAVLYVPALQGALHTVPLGWGDWGAIAGVALPVFAAVEMYKWAAWGRREGVPSESPEGRALPRESRPCADR